MLASMVQLTKEAVGKLVGQKAWTQVGCVEEECLTMIAVEKIGQVCQSLAVFVKMKDPVDYWVMRIGQEDHY